MTRRDLLIGAGSVLAVGAAAADVPGLPVGDPVFNARVLGRLQGDLSGRQRWIYNPGHVYATIPGQGLAPAEFARLLFRVDGVTVRISRLLADGGVEERSESWMFYRHATEERYLEVLDNPWTGTRLQVPPYRGGPAHSVLRPATGVDPRTNVESTVIGAPVSLGWRVQGAQVFLNRHVASRIRSSSGGMRNEFSIDAWVCRLADLRDATLTHLPSTYAWTSQGEWQDWLGMDRRPGGLVWRVESTVLEGPDALPGDFVRRMEKLLPGRLVTRLAF